MVSDAGGGFAVQRLRVDVSKNSSTAASSKLGELDTSTTTEAPRRASLRPSRVTVLTPESKEADTTSWPSARRATTSLDPMSPLPPMITIFIVDLPSIVA